MTLPFTIEHDILVETSPHRGYREATNAEKALWKERISLRIILRTIFDSSKCVPHHEVMSPACPRCTAREALKMLGGGEPMGDFPIEDRISEDTKHAAAQIKLRRCERFRGDSWSEVDLKDIKTGDVFRMFEADGTLEHGCEGNIAEGDAFLTNGVWGVKCRPTPAQELKNLQMLVPVAEEALAFILQFAEPSPMYGGFHGGDPRDFTPDPEVTKPEEIEAWKKACDEFAAGRIEPLPDQHELIRDDKGRAVAHFARYNFGMGVSLLRDPFAEALVKKLAAAIGKARGR
jgi:hypothetical protein